MRDRELCDKPTLDGEPSYERILQGLHDKTQPYWTAKDVRRYAYWSVFAGACGHTYGDNSVMQFYTEESEGVTYGAEDYWQDAMHHEGSGQMGHLKRLMESVDFRDGIIRDDLLVNGQGKSMSGLPCLQERIFCLPMIILVFHLQSTFPDMRVRNFGTSCPQQGFSVISAGAGRLLPLPAAPVL